MILCILTYIIVCILMYFIPEGSAVAGNELDCVKQNLYFLMICEQDCLWSYPIGKASTYAYVCEQNLTVLNRISIFLMICEQNYVYDHIFLEQHLRMHLKKSSIRRHFSLSLWTSFWSTESHFSVNTKNVILISKDEWNYTFFPWKKNINYYFNDNYYYYFWKRKEKVI